MSYAEDGVVKNKILKYATRVMRRVIGKRRKTYSSYVQSSLSLILIGFFLFAECGILNATTEIKNYDVSAKQVKQAIEQSTSYLVKANDRTGRFTYRVHLSSLYFSKQKYNILRHAGTMYALTQAWQQKPDENIKATLSRSVRFLIANCIAPIPDYEKMLGIWSLSEITYSDNPPQIKLGGAGLGLAALVSTEKILPGTISLDDLRKIGRFVLFMQNQDGSFITKYVPSKGGKDPLHVSQYYPGEAALGLLMLYQMDRSQQWLDAASKALAYIITTRRMTTSDQWSLIACARLLSLKKYPENILPRHKIIAYAQQVSMAILEEQILYSDQQQLIGCFNKEGRTTPTATRVEALFATLDILGHEDIMLKNLILSSIHSAVGFLLDAQVTEGKYAGGIPRTTGLSAVDRIFDQRAQEIRIDYVQHMLSALIRFEQLIY